MSQLIKQLGFFPRTLKPFEYYEPESIEEAAQILAKGGELAKPLAGGLDLVPRMRRRQFIPSCLVSLHRIPGLDYIKGNGDGLVFGPLTSILAIERSSLVQKDYGALYEAARQIASVQVKNTGSAVGNLCVATPASDIAVALVALGANLRIAGPCSERVLPIEDFHLGVNKTSLQPGEIVTEVKAPPPLGCVGEAFIKMVRTSADIAKVNVAVSLTAFEGMCRGARIALGSVAPTVIRAKSAEQILIGNVINETIIKKAAERAAEETKPISDIRSTAEYRREISRVLVERALRKALRNARSNDGA